MTRDRRIVAARARACGRRQERRHQVMSFAAVRPDVVKTITLVCSPVNAARRCPAGSTRWTATACAAGRSWTRAERLGSKMPERGIDWWVRSDGADGGFDRPRVRELGRRRSTNPRRHQALKCPTLVIGNGHERTRAWRNSKACQKKIPDSELVAIKVDGYHAAGGRARRMRAGNPRFHRAPRRRKQEEKAAPVLAGAAGRSIRWLEPVLPDDRRGGRCGDVFDQRPRRLCLLRARVDAGREHASCAASRPAAVRRNRCRRSARAR